MILLVSEKAISQFKQLKTGDEDYLLKEWELALEYYNKEQKKIFPILLGQEILGQEVPEEQKIPEQANKHNSEYYYKQFNFHNLEYPNHNCKTTNMTVQSIVEQIFKIQSKTANPQDRIDIILDELVDFLPD